MMSRSESGAPDVLRPGELPSGGTGSPVGSGTVEERVRCTEGGLRGRGLPFASGFSGPGRG